ncbi:MAG: 16S rRNA (cytidine(1402)-2'-O)-methyltransferase [Patescibacteria group bacterium]
MATLYIVATPIGNLSDITIRALEILRRVSVVYGEDTRVTRKLFERHGITTLLRSYHQHSSSQKVKEVIESLQHGDVALVTDAGTPGVADPGNELVAQLVWANGRSPVLSEIKIVPIPGPSAVMAAASVCGFNMSAFTFLGYVPKKKGRQKFFRAIAESDIPVTLYETPHRIIRTLEELHGTIVEWVNSTQPPLKVRGGEGGVMKYERRRLVVCRELTKIYESIYRGTIEEVLAQVRRDPMRGEYVVIIDGNT